MKLFWKIMFLLCYITATFSISNAQAQQNLSIAYNPAMSERDLLPQSQQRLFAPSSYKLTYSKYDLKQGLETIYEDIEGKRIYFRSLEIEKNKFQIRVSHYSASSKKIETLIESGLIGGENKITVAGINLTEMINYGRKNKRFQEPHLKKLKAFMRTEEGIASLNGIAAIYLALESNGVSPAVEKLKVPL